MAKVQITNNFVTRTICKEDKIKEVYYDIDLIGFILEIRATGSKTFYFQSSINGKRKMIKIGNYPSINANDAKLKCLELKESLNKQNLNQIKSEKNQLNPITFQEFYDNYYLPYIKINIKSYETNISVFKNHILSHLANTSMCELKKNQVMQYHSSMVKEKNLAAATANKFLIFLSKAYRIAHEFELLPSNINPCKGVKEFELNNQRQIFLNQTQTKRLLKEVELSSNIHLKYIIPMLLLTGARKREVLDAKWNDFDMLNNLWTIPITKNGKKRILPVTKPLQTILNQIPKDKTPYLFASPITLKPYISIYQSWNNARVKANLKEVRMHDLRHTYASALVNAKCSLYEVQVLLGHSTAKMTQRYAHLSNESLMRAASNAGKLLK